MRDLPILFTSSQVAEMLGVSPTFMSRMVARGIVPPPTRGKNPLRKQYNEADVDEIEQRLKAHIDERNKAREETE
jgi:hypothetical protein